MPLMSIMETRAVLDTCAYDSLLTVTVQDPSKRVPQAENIKADLDKALQRGGNDMNPRRVTPDISRRGTCPLRTMWPHSGTTNSQVRSKQEIFNHVLNDVEIFMDIVVQAANTSPANEGKNKKKASKKKKSKQKGKIPQRSGADQKMLGLRQVYDVTVFLQHHQRPICHTGMIIAHIFRKLNMDSICW
ncbi:hypothetical protein XENOCAPTIV_005449 [Xenoophorus captivus]|uniref:EPS8 spectrin-like domain-containing protein n=1 Tax=Xenoophorus captivus TaxID=1517983 RepID=A0ABV0R8X4_9TELE